MDDVQNNQDMEDKRRYKRVASEAPIFYKNLRVPTDMPVGSIARNLCEGGICFQTGKFISLACRLVVEISIPNLPKPIKAISKVAWIRKMPTSNLYELGNQFLEISKEDKSHILNFINQSLSSGPANQTPPAV